MVKNEDKPVRRNRRKRYPKLRRLTRRTILFMLGMLFILSSLALRAHDDSKFSFASAKINYATAEERSTPTFIRIPSLNITLPIQGTKIKKGDWEVSNRGVSHLSTSAVPGEQGNIIMYSHNTNNRFGPLPSIGLGDRIYLVTQDGILHEYIVTETFSVAPDDLSVIANTKTETLTLYTCIGFADTQRFVVRAIPTDY